MWERGYTPESGVHGFVEFASADTAAQTLAYSRLVVTNGLEKLLLRLKCSPLKQRILGCMAYDANAVNGTLCGVGRGYLAEGALEDALLADCLAPFRTGSPRLCATRFE
ncbi:hypothetical protein LSCM1_01400 [Leishmania martiniquensis]|uniref:Uncharacterized protein n=1 Tax=Leishmania martiniquensis TaxID=1580590 RepID=A0A836KET4_9TRYP|nr:hypothetical protein LSCM1_01400 [Leishmania martiniquensis]